MPGGMDDHHLRPEFPGRSQGSQQAGPRAFDLFNSRRQRNPRMSGPGNQIDLRAFFPERDAICRPQMLKMGETYSTELYKPAIHR